MFASWRRRAALGTWATVAQLALVQTRLRRLWRAWRRQRVVCAAVRRALWRRSHERRWALCLAFGRWARSRRDFSAANFTTTTASLAATPSPDMDDLCALLNGFRASAALEMPAEAESRARHPAALRISRPRERAVAAEG